MVSTVFFSIFTGDRQHDNQGSHGHLREIQNKLRGLADHIQKKEAPAVLPPIQFKDQSVGGRSIVSWLSPCGAPPTVTGKASPRLVPIPLTPPSHSHALQVLWVLVYHSCHLIILMTSA